MEFTSRDYVLFLLLVVGLYWTFPRKGVQNSLLLFCSYLFYGYVHPWFCTLIFLSTLVDYYSAQFIEDYSHWKKSILSFSLVINLGVLALFKYFNFFVDNLRLIPAFSDLPLMEVVLPVGISFYTFQTISYTVDVYRGELRACRSVVDFALFVAFFPQLVAGPIERAGNLLRQLQQPRWWDSRRLPSIISLFILGYFKKLVVADNIALWVDRVFMLEHPSFPLFFMGSLGFAIQIYADFSAYTDIARASARLLGIELMENFRSPFLACTPSDFWRRWHISFSSWIRDYLYIPLGGSKNRSWMGYGATVLCTMGLSGLWHGAAWHFVAWGVFHGMLLLVYRLFGFDGKWKPSHLLSKVSGWALFQCLSVFAWGLFRCENLGWVYRICSEPSLRLGFDEVLVLAFLGVCFAAYSSLWIGHHIVYRRVQNPALEIGWQWAALAAICILANRIPHQFIYFQF